MEADLKKPNATDDAVEPTYTSIHRQTANWAYDEILGVDLCETREQRSKQGFAAEKIYKSDTPYGTAFILTWKKQGAYTDPNQTSMESGNPAFPTPA